MRNRHAGSARLGALAGTAVLSCGLVSVLLAGTRAAPAQAAKNPCANRPAAVTVASARNASQDTGIALVASVSDRSNSATPTSSASLTPGPSPNNSTSSPSNSPSPSASPSKSSSGPSPATSPTPAKSSPSPNKSTPLPTKSPSPSPSKSKSPSPSPSPTPNRKTAHLCVSVQPFSSKAQVHPGGTATYVIWVWSTRADAKAVTIDAAIRHVKRVGAPRFTVCPSRSGATCALGDLPRGRADELKVRVKVHKAAHPGRHVTLTAKARAKGATSVSAAGSVKIVSTRAPATPAATPPPSTPPVPPLPPIPPLPAASAGGTSPAGLFPTVSPQPSTSPPSASTAVGRRHSRAIKATSAADTLPLNPRLIGGQLAGLVVLAAAITIAIARLSLRPQRPEDGNGSSGEH